MNDFFLPPSNEDPRIQVPFLLGACDGIRSLSLDQIRSRDSIPKQLAAWMQDHLFFQVLEKFLNHEYFDRGHFSTSVEPPETPHLKIDHAECHKLFLMWQRKNIDHLDRAERAAYIIHTKEELLERHRVTESLESLEYSGEDSEQAVAKVTLSVKLLLGTLNAVVENALPAGVVPQVKCGSWLSHQRISRRPSSYESLTSHVLDERAGWPTTVSPAGCDRLPPVAKLLVEKLMDNHFCEAQATRLCSQFGILTINYLCRTVRTLPEHINHDACTSAQCTAYSSSLTLTAPREVQHAYPDCVRKRTPDIGERVRRLVGQGNVPLVRLEFRANSKIQDVNMSIVKMTPLSRYVAISHLWVDGLGNIMDNSLCECQLRKLATYLQPFSGGTGSRRNVLFWMDTFCIPTKTDLEESSARLKKAAIGKMALIYAGAQCALILDSELMNWNDAEHVTEYQHKAVLATKLISSGWMTRSWTLQEGGLARSIYVATAGGPKALFDGKSSSTSRSEYWREDVISKMLEGSPVQISMGECNQGRSAIQSPLMLEMVRHTDDFMRLLVRPLQLQSKQRGQPHSDGFEVSEDSLRLSQFIEVWNALRGRQTTEAEDRHLILASLWDLSAPAVSREAENDRLPKMINTCRQLPLSILYDTGQRVGNRSSSEDLWLPTEVSDDPMIKGSYLQRGSEGFAVHFSLYKGVSPRAYFVHSPAPPRGKFFRLCVHSMGPKCFYTVERCDDNAWLQAEIGSTPEHLVDSTATQVANEADPLLPGERNRPCRILIMDPHSGNTSVHGYTGRGVELSVGERDTSDTYFTKYSTPVKFWSDDQFNQHFGYTPFRYGLFNVTDRSQETRLIVNYGDWTRASQATFSYFNIIASRPLYENAPIATIPRRPILSQATWRREFCWILSMFFRIFMLYYIFLETRDWILRRCQKDGRTLTCSFLNQKFPETGYHRTPLSSVLHLLVLPASVVAILGVLTYSWAAAINTYKRITWLLTFEEDWHYVPSFLESWEIFLDAILIVLMVIVLVVLQLGWFSAG